MNREEHINEILGHFATLTLYWRDLDLSGMPPEEQLAGRLSGLTFSILSSLDGCSLGLMGGYSLRVVEPTPDGGNTHYRVSGDLHDRWHGVLAAAEAESQADCTKRPEATADDRAHNEPGTEGDESQKQQAQSPGGEGKPSRSATPEAGGSQRPPVDDC